MNGAQAKKIASVALLPGIVPRAKKLFASGFSYIAFLMANIYSAVRLLPREHPYLNPVNIGRYGVRHVIAEAANNLTLSFRNIDQIVVFFALLLGMMIIVVQFAVLIYAIIFQPAHAASIFLTPNPSTGAVSQDMAFIVLDQVFGIRDLFCTIGNNCTAINATLPWPFHTAFHQLLRFYSMGLLMVGVFIFLYYVLIVIGETATTGHPFGQRFQNAWTPVRLVVALGLLVPVQNGLNSSQYIVLYAAKYGSGFATNGWRTFNNTLGAASNPVGEPNGMLARPQNPDVMPLVQTMTLVNACAYSYWRFDTGARGMGAPPATNFYIQPYLVKTPQPWMPNTNEFMLLTETTTIVQAMDFYNNGDIIIRFGRRDLANETYNRQKGRVMPYCGDVRIPINYTRTRGRGISDNLGGPDAMQEHYFNMVRSMWFSNEDTDIVRALPHRFIEFTAPLDNNRACQIACPTVSLPSCTTGGPACNRHQVTADARSAVLRAFQPTLDDYVETSWDDYNQNSTDMQMQNAILDRGWAGAGIWYNTIAEMNGAFMSSVVNIPTFSRYPDVMERVREQRRKNDVDVSPKMQFNPNLANAEDLSIGGQINNLEVAQRLNDFYKWWNDDDPNSARADKTVQGSTFHDAINAIFGMTGLLNMQGKNAHIHPLAQLAAVGKSLVDSAIINIGTSTITAGLGGIIRVIDQHGALGPVAEVASSITMTIAFLGLTAGFILYYVLPFLPFLYFFFAFGTWIKSIFEAMVGAPLWALAHLRIDGEGLPGDSASSGYFLIFEIFIRPILTVFGLIAAVLILTAQVRILNFLWIVVTTNLTGSHQITAMQATMLPRNTIDQFFFTIVYAIIVYMMATASFKMIDKIPDQLLRFMGAGVSSFSDINPDPTEGLTRYAALGGITVGKELTQGIRGLTKSGGDALGGELGAFADAMKKGS